MSAACHVNCNLCGADDYVVLFPKGAAQFHRIVRCKRCGLMYANPQEKVDCEVVKTPEYPKVFDIVWSKRFFRKQHVQLPDYLEVLKAVNRLAPRRGKLLEIGCHCGIFLNEIREDGWDVTGLEPDIGVANYARDNYRLNVIDGILPQPALAPGTFDAIVMLHVIEHMPDPLSSLREIRKLLKPGGILAVETPRFDSLSFKILGRRERNMAVHDGHIYFFTVATLRRMLEKNGFRAVQSNLVGRTLTVDRFLYNIGTVSRSDRVKRWVDKVGEIFRLDRASFHLNIRDLQRMYSRAE
jgi:SAM-dependent methyltransferase